ncbi:MAG: hypothetical protein JZU50_06585 [Desulfobulbaceae bacterium]|nr:hypothetical protein [Desulfobulbaceae bacterium]
MNKRLFVAIDPPSEIREQVATICCGLPDARWIPPEQLHLTLCFIGEVSSSAFLDIREVLREIKLPWIPCVAWESIFACVAGVQYHATGCTASTLHSQVTPGNEELATICCGLSDLSFRPQGEISGCGS